MKAQLKWVTGAPFCDAVLNSLCNSEAICKEGGTEGRF